MKKPIAGLDAHEKQIQGEIRERQRYLRELRGIREQFSRALPAGYVYEKILLKRKEGVSHIPTGIPWWDEWAGPFRRGNLYCLAGYGGSGKTTLAVNLTWPMAQRTLKVWNYCLELTADEMFEVVAGHVIGKAKLSEADETQAYSIIDPTGYRFFEPQRDMTWKEHIELICKTVREDNIDFVVVDNFSYLTASGNDSYEVERVVAKSLKGLAQELEIPILCIAHLRKPDKDDSEPKPTVHTVLGSGALPQNSSDTFILHHPLRLDQEFSTRHPVGYILSGKPRWGLGGKLYLFLDGATRKYSLSTSSSYQHKSRGTNAIF